jgi:hypothetical protein
MMDKTDLGAEFVDNIVHVDSEQVVLSIDNIVHVDFVWFGLKMGNYFPVGFE